MNWQFSFTTCEFTWWEHLIWTLIPFLLGLLLGYLLWYRYRRYIQQVEDDLDAVRAEQGAIMDRLDEKDKTIEELEARLARSESDLSSSRVAYRSLQTRHDTMKSDADKAKSSDIVVGAGDVPKAETPKPKPPKVVAKPAAPRRKKEDLTRIEGIGPKVEELLNKNNIKSYADLGSTKVPALRKVLKEGGRNFQQFDPGTWPKQSRLAADGEWDKLKKLQDRLIGGREPSKARVDPDVGGTAAFFGKKIKLNDLKLIEGIGPKIEKLLNNAGIITWWQLSDTPVKSVQKILDEAGSRYRLADPATWPKQARMAARGQWKKLKTYQDKLDGGRA